MSAEELSIFMKKSSLYLD